MLCGICISDMQLSGAKSIATTTETPGFSDEVIEPMEGVEQINGPTTDNHEFPADSMHVEHQDGGEELQEQIDGGTFPREDHCSSSPGPPPESDDDSEEDHPTGKGGRPIEETQPSKKRKVNQDSEDSDGNTEHKKCKHDSYLGDRNMLKSITAKSTIASMMKRQGRALPGINALPADTGGSSSSQASSSRPNESSVMKQGHHGSGRGGRGSRGGRATTTSRGGHH